MRFINQMQNIFHIYRNEFVWSRNRVWGIEQVGTNRLFSLIWHPHQRYFAMGHEGHFSYIHFYFFGFAYRNAF